jgi:hypothetical protein
MRGFPRVPLTLLAVVALLVVSAGTVGAGPNPPLTNWSAWQKYFTPIIPPSSQGPGNPIGMPIPTANPSNDLLWAWVNAFNANPPAPSLAAHAEEVARGVDHSSIIGHGPTVGEPGAQNAWANGNVLRTDRNAGPFFETFSSFYGVTTRMIPNLWGAYAYRGAGSVTFDAESFVKNEPASANGYSMKVAGSVPFEAGISREIKVTPGAQVKVRVMYALYDHGGTHGGNTWTYDWACLGVKADDNDAVWVNGPWHGQWLPLEYTTKAGPQGRIMIFLQVMSPMPENVNAYFDNVQVWVNGQSYTGG